MNRNIFLAALALAFAPIVAFAASVGAIANPVIDQVQGEIVTWVVAGAVSAFFGVASWFGGVIGVRVTEKMNRATLQEAAERYANGLIDLAQARYLDASPSSIEAMVAEGVGYIKTANAGTIRQLKIKDDRIGAYVTEAIQKVKADRLSSVLDRALSGKIVADRTS